MQVAVGKLQSVDVLGWDCLVSGLLMLVDIPAVLAWEERKHCLASDPSYNHMPFMLSSIARIAVAVDGMIANYQ